VSSALSGVIRTGGWTEAFSSMQTALIDVIESARTLWPAGHIVGKKLKASDHRELKQRTRWKRARRLKM